MPINFSISKEDLLRGKQGAPGWYLLNIRSVTEGPGKNDPTSNTVTIAMTIKDGPDKAVIGAPVNHYLSEKAPGMAVPFIEAVTGKKLPEGGAVPDVEKAQGRDVKAYLKWDLNFKTWKCEDFMPAVGKVEA
jgi:hypothetical protein